MAAGAAKGSVSFARDTYSFEFPGPPSTLVEAFRNFYGPTMNAFEAAAKSGRADDLQRELDTLFNRQNQSANRQSTSIPATFLKVTVAV